MTQPGNNQPYTLITGASAGLGKALAFECAERNRNLFLVALPGDGLGAVSQELKKHYDVHIRSIELDLTKTDSLTKLLDVIPDQGVNCLINNVGMGGTLIFEDASVAYLNKMIDLNIRTGSLLTYYFLPELHKHKEAQIVNISSLISQYPSPFKTLYPASKAFVYYFSKGLRSELRNTQIGVTVAPPGPMQTNAEISARINRQGRFAKMAVLSPDQVAKRILDGCIKNRSVVIPGVINKLYWLLMKVLPLQIGMPILYRVYWKEMKSRSKNQQTDKVDIASHGT
jgi:short-subunit dehydrogenase